MIGRLLCALGWHEDHIEWTLGQPMAEELYVCEQFGYRRGWPAYRAAQDQRKWLLIALGVMVTGSVTSTIVALLGLLR